MSYFCKRELSLRHLFLKITSEDLWVYQGHLNFGLSISNDTYSLNDSQLQKLSRQKHQQTDKQTNKKQTDKQINKPKKLMKK